MINEVKSEKFWKFSGELFQASDDKNIYIEYVVIQSVMNQIENIQNHLLINILVAKVSVLQHLSFNRLNQIV